MDYKPLIACHECDALFRESRLNRKSSAHCLRCGAILYRSPARRFDGICALTLAALFTFLIAQGFPILELQTAGIRSETTLFSALVVLWNEDMQVVAVMVFCFTFLFPLTELVALLYVLIPIRQGYVPAGFNRVLRAIQFVRPWGMIEVFMLGVLITIVKMVSLARVIPEAALFAFGALTLMFVLVVTFDPRILWKTADKLGEHDAEPTRGAKVGSSVPSRLASTSPRKTVPAKQCLTAWRAGLVGCHACGQVSPYVASIRTRRCARCGAILHRRNPNSLTRTWALLISAALLYIPANLLPVMHTSSLVGSEDDTIMSGVVYFWTSGSWPLAVVVFVASILVPMLKLSVLLLLAATTQRRSSWRRLERLKLYRIVERIGRWSMLDVFVVTLTVALVRFGSLAVITAGPGALAFGCVVILTMTASMQFDPRLIWDAGVGRNPALTNGLEANHE